MQSYTKYSSIYFLKCIGAFFVICIHVLLFYSNIPAITLLTPLFRTAVPLFFAISGYFLFRSDRDQAIAQCKKTLRRIIWITIYAYILFFICKPDSFNSLKIILYYIIFGYDHLWWLNAYIETLICFIILLKLKQLRIIWIIAPIFFAYGLTRCCYAWLVDSSYSLWISRNGLTLGIPFVWLGWQIRKHKELILSKTTRPRLATLIVIALAFSETEVFLLRPYTGDFYISTLLLVTAIFLLAIKYPTFAADTAFERIGQHYSLYIYIFHFIIIYQLNSLFPAFFSFTPYYLIPLIVFFLTLAFVYVWRQASVILFPQSANHKCP